MANLLKSKIICLDCGKNYKFKMLRKKPAYICSGFANYSKNFCINLTLEEEDLIYIIKKHQKIVESFDEDILDYIDVIEVSPKHNTFTIKYMDGTESISSPNRLKF